MPSVALIVALAVPAYAQAPRRPAPLADAIVAAVQDLAAADPVRRFDAVTTIGHVALVLRPVARPADLLSAVGPQPPRVPAALDHLRAAVPLLHALLQDGPPPPTGFGVASDPRTKAEAVWALGAIGPDAAMAFDAITTFLNDRTLPSTLRQYAPAALQRIAEGKSVGAIAAALDADRTDRLIVSACLFALAQAGADGVAPLLGFLSTDDPILREWTIEALGRIGPPASAAGPGLEKVLQGADPHLRSAALIALVKIFPQATEIQRTLTAIVDSAFEPRPMCETAVTALARLPGSPSADMHRCAMHRQPPAAASTSHRYAVTCASPSSAPDAAPKGLAEVSQATSKTLTLIATRIDRTGAVLDSRRGDVDAGAQGFECTRVSIDPPDDPARWPVVGLEYSSMHRGRGTTQIHWRALVDTGSMRTIQRLPERFTRTGTEGAASSDRLGMLAETGSSGMLMYGRSSGQFQMVAGSPAAPSVRFVRRTFSAPGLLDSPLSVDAETVLRGPWASIETPPPPSAITPPLGASAAEAQTFWRKQLGHPHLAVRLQAAQALARVVSLDPGVLRQIALMIESPSDLAAIIADILRPAVLQALPHVAPLLSHPRRDVRVRAASVLINLGPPAAGAISAAMNNRLEREAILDANVYPLPFVTADALPGLLDALGACDHPEPGVSIKRCWDTIRLLTDLGQEAAPARDRLRDLLPRSRDHQQILVAQALYGLGDEEQAWHTFAGYTTSVEFAGPAFAAMMAADSVRATPVVLAALQADAPAGSNAVVEAVKFLKIDAAVLMPIVRSMMGRADHRSRIRAISVLASVRSAEALELAASALGDPEPQVRKTAYSIVEGYEAEALPWLQKIALDRSSLRRESAILKMAMLGVAATPALDDLKVLEEDPDERVRTAARNAVLLIQKKR